MRVEMTTRIGGFRNLEPWPEVGETIELPDHEGADLVAAGYAKEVHGDRPQTGPDDGGEPTAEEGPETVEDDGGEPTGEALSKDDLIVQAGALGVEVDKRWSVKRIAEAIANA